MIFLEQLNFCTCWHWTVMVQKQARKRGFNFFQQRSNAHKAFHLALYLSHAYNRRPTFYVHVIWFHDSQIDLFRLIDSFDSWLLFQAISFTILRYRKLKAAFVEHKKHHTPNLQKHTLPFLVEAWKPMSMGFKRRYFCRQVFVFFELSSTSTPCSILK